MASEEVGMVGMGFEGVDNNLGGKNQVDWCESGGGGIGVCCSVKRAVLVISLDLR